MTFLNRRQYAGLSILVSVAIVIVVLQAYSGTNAGTPGVDHGDDITVNGLIGGKEAFFNDPEIAEILKEKYGLTVTYRRLGSPAMVKECKAGLDFCWPSNQNSGQEIKDSLTAGTFTDKVVFHTPVVFYTWAPVVEALVQQGIVAQRDNVYYVANFSKLIQLMLDDAQWSDIGLPQLHGDVYVKTSDPTTSTTGNAFVGLVANTLNGGDPVDGATLDGVKPQLQTLFKDRLMAENNTKLFEDYLTKGMGDSPIIASIESNLIEYSLANPEPAVQEYIRQNLVMLYPEPTILTSQPLIALSDGGKRLMEALRDPEIQRLGWVHHAFRSAVPGVTNDPLVSNYPGMRPTIVDSVIAMPVPAVMDEIIQSLEPTPTAGNTGSGTASAAVSQARFSPPGSHPITGNLVDRISPARAIQFLGMEVERDGIDLESVIRHGAALLSDPSLVGHYIEYVVRSVLVRQACGHLHVCPDD